MKRAGVALLFLALGACSKSPTVVLTMVSADANVPPVLLLQTHVASVADPARTDDGAIRSLDTNSDASDRPAPFVFPLYLPITVDASLAGAVTVAVEGLDWDTHAVIASGSTSATVVAEGQTQAVVTLQPPSVPPPSDGSGADGATIDTQP
jgi:hypothetical protein